MAKSSDIQHIAGTLHASLMTTVVEQLQAAAPKLAKIDGNDEGVESRVKSALPKNALPQVQNFVLGLAREGLLGQIKEIVAALEQYSDESEVVALDAEVTSAMELKKAQRNKIEADLRERYGQEVNVAYKVDEALIGGLIIRVGDQVLDNSLRTRLSAVQRDMLAS